MGTVGISALIISIENYRESHEVGQYLSNTLYRALLYVYIHLFADSKFMEKKCCLSEVLLLLQTQEKQGDQIFFIEIRYLQRDRERQGD